MKLQEMKKLQNHYNRFFEQYDCTVLHDNTKNPVHIDILRYEANKKYPYWKLVTMGASDYKMPKSPAMLGDRNEYMMFVDPSVDLNDAKVLSWYYRTLMTVALQPVLTSSFQGYGHVLDWDKTEESDMVGAFLSMPENIEDVRILTCSLGLFKKTVCLQVVTVTESEMAQLAQIGPEAFCSVLYPENGEKHFLCEQFRGNKF